MIFFLIRSFRKNNQSHKAGFISREWFPDFAYMKDKYGQAYGWGVAKYSTPEAQFGYDFVTSAYRREPEESKKRIISHLKTVLPEADTDQLLKLIK